MDLLFRAPPLRLHFYGPPSSLCTDSPLSWHPIRPSNRGEHRSVQYLGRRSRFLNKLVETESTSAARNSESVFSTSRTIRPQLRQNLIGFDVGDGGH